MPRTSVIQGTGFIRRPVFGSRENARVSIENDGAVFQLSNDRLTKHILAIGAPGFGKTVALLQIAEQLRATASVDDVFVFFDTKGDYQGRLRKTGDSVISYGADANAVWNIYSDLLADGDSEDDLYDNAYEISSMLFYDKLQNSPNPFFPNAARDLMMGLLFSFAMQGKEDSRFRATHLNNKALASFLRTRFTPENIAQELRQYDATKGIVTAFSVGEQSGQMNPQSQGVISEAATVGRDVFKGCFAGNGDFSLRQFIRRRGARALFIEYDLYRGNTLLPIYRTLCDLILKEALARNANRQGRVYVFMDELRLLPDLQYLENAVNFGRGMGVTIVAGLQAVSQVQQTYGEYGARSILDNFGTAIMFNTSDPSTREVIAGRVGKNVRLESYPTAHGRMEERERISNVIEDWDISRLGIGDAIIHSIGSEPYTFHFPDRS